MTAAQAIQLCNYYKGEEECPFEAEEKDALKNITSIKEFDYFCIVNERKDIIVANTLAGIGKGEVAGYLCHAYV